MQRQSKLKALKCKLFFSKPGEEGTLTLIVSQHLVRIQCSRVFLLPLWFLKSLGLFSRLWAASCTCSVLSSTHLKREPNSRQLTANTAFLRMTPTTQSFTNSSVSILQELNYIPSYQNLSYIISFCLLCICCVSKALCVCCRLNVENQPR